MSTSIGQFQPAFSVVVPTYNRPEPLARCLRALAAQDYPSELLEVIVVDDGGEEDLTNVTSRFERVRLLRQDNAGPAAARNAGAAVAENDWLAFTDDDCIPHPDWLLHIASAVTRNRSALVGGYCLNALSNSLCAAASQLILNVVHEHFNGDHDHAVFFPSDNMVVARQRFLEIGGFDERFRWSEDRDLCDRWASRGWPLIVEPRALVDHAHVMGLPGFLGQHFGYGRGAWRFHRARKARRAGHTRPQGSFYLKCFIVPFRTERVRRAVALAGLMGFWQVANTLGFLYQGLSEAMSGRKSHGMRSSSSGSATGPPQSRAFTAD